MEEGLKIVRNIYYQVCTGPTMGPGFYWALSTNHF